MRFTVKKDLTGPRLASKGSGRAAVDITNGGLYIYTDHKANIKGVYRDGGQEDLRLYYHSLLTRSVDARATEGAGYET